MSREALQLKNEVAKTLREQGTLVTYRTVTQGAYNPLTGSAETTSDTTMKAHIARSATRATARVFLGDYERSLTIQRDTEPSKKDNIVIGSDVYNIVYIAPIIINGITIKYEVLIKR
jgi:hypothetical protein